MKHYRVYFTNPHFYIADSSVSALIRMLKRMDSELKVSRGKIKDGHIIYFDSAIEDADQFRLAIRKFIEEKKYEFHQFHLEVLKNSAVGISESLIHIIPLNKFNTK